MEHTEEMSLPYPTILHYSIASFTFTVAFFSIVGNLLTIIILKSESIYSQQIRIYRIQLALSHVISCVTTYWMYIISSINGTWVFGNIGCTFYGFLQGFCAIFSMLIVAAIAFNRAFSLKTITRPSLRETIRNSAILWIITFALSSPPVFGWNRYIIDGLGTTCCFDLHANDLRSRCFLLYIMLFGFVVPLAVIFYSYHRVAMVLFQSAIFRKQSHSRTVLTNFDEISPLNQPTPPLTYDSLQFFEDLSVFAKLVTIWRDRRNFQNLILPLRTMFIIIICFVIAWLPYAVLAIVAQFASSESIGPYAVTAAGLVAKSYVAFDPVIYVLTDESFRRRMLDMFRRVGIAKSSDV